MARLSSCESNEHTEAYCVVLRGGFLVRCRCGNPDLVGAKETVEIEKLKAAERLYKDGRNNHRSNDRD